MNKIPLKRVLITVIVSLIIVLISRSMSNKIILFPFWLNTILYVVSLAITGFYCFQWKIFSSEKKEDKKVSSIFNGVLAIVLAFVLLSAFRLPINFVIQQQAKKNEIITAVCPITFYSIGLKNQTKKHISFSFQNKSIRMKVRPSTMAKIKSLPTPNKHITLQLRKSILGTYVVENYDVY